MRLPMLERREEAPQSPSKASAGGSPMSAILSTSPMRGGDHNRMSPTGSQVFLGTSPYPRDACYLQAMWPQPQGAILGTSPKPSSSPSAAFMSGGSATTPAKACSKPP